MSDFNVNDDESYEKSEMKILEENAILSEVEEESIEIVKKVAELHELCEYENMCILQKRFVASEDALMGPAELRVALREVLQADYDDEDFHLTFLKMNSSKTGYVNWDEFISYLLLLFADKERLQMRVSGGLLAPITEKPSVYRSRHPHAVCCMCFCPQIDEEKEKYPIQGTYITLSPDGVINTWNLNMQRIRKTIPQCTSRKGEKGRVMLVTAACLPDVNIFAISTTENDLLFYDTTAGVMVERVIIRKWDYKICTLFYHSNAVQSLFTEEVEESENISKSVSRELAFDKQTCLLLAGDEGGNVYVMMFSPIMRGPFKKRLATALTELKFKNFLKGKLEGMKVREYRKMHAGPVCQVSYYTNIQSVLSCSLGSSLILCSVVLSLKPSVFSLPHGILCFTCNEYSQTIASGESDGTVCLWSLFMPARPIAVMLGHRSKIVALIFQNKGQRLYSIDVSRTIKVWNCMTHACLQTFIDMPDARGDHMEIVTLYNPGTRNWIIGSSQIVVVACDPLLNERHIDGFTHSKPVTVVLYNPLFKSVLTCGMDSIIITWDIMTGVRQTTIYEAHIKILNFETIPVEITAATFDPGYQSLLTGARDGSLKTWNFNTGTCLRNMAIEHNCVITHVSWIVGRIIATGWNRHITEFDDSPTRIGNKGKNWENRHEADISAVAIQGVGTLASLSYSGELCFWKLDTGRIIRRYSCHNPNDRIQITYNKKTAKNQNSSSNPQMHKKKSLYAFKKDSIGDSTNIIEMLNPEDSKKSLQFDNIRTFAAHAAIYLQTRPNNALTATLFVSIDNGTIQAWSDNTGASYMGSFKGIQTHGDYVTAMATDENNMYLFTGTAFGYIKIWLMQNYKTSEKEHLSMPLLRLRFPFLWRDRFVCRAMRCISDQSLPLLLSSYRAHLRCINSLVYVHHHDFLLSGSADMSVRIWRLGGEYLGSLGTFLPWKLEPRYPPDVRKVASSTTLKLWNGGKVSRKILTRRRPSKECEMTDATIPLWIAEKIPTDEFLENLCRLPMHPPTMPSVHLDDSMPHVPIFTHLKTLDEQSLPARPQSPTFVQCVRRRREEQGRVAPKRELTFMANKT